MSRTNKQFELSPKLKWGVGRGYSQNQILKVSGIIFLVLAASLTVNAVRLIAVHHTGSAQANNEGQVLGASDTRTVDAATAVQFVEYKVQKGDTLFNISQKFNISWTTLATLNNLQSPFTLKAGQILKVPKQ